MIWSSQAFIFYAHPAVISLHLARVLQPADCLGGFVFTPALPWSGAQYSTRECDVGFYTSSTKEVLLVVVIVVTVVVVVVIVVVVEQ